MAATGARVCGRDRKLQLNQEAFSERIGPRGRLLAERTRRRRAEEWSGDGDGDGDGENERGRCVKCERRAPHHAERSLA